jgi:hypothetical protein
MEAEEPQDFGLLVPSDEELVVMELGGASRHLKNYIIIN